MINVLTDLHPTRYSVGAVSPYYGYRPELDVDASSCKLWIKMSYWLNMEGDADAVLLMVADQHRAKSRMELMEKIEASLPKTHRKIHFNAVFLNGCTETGKSEVWGSVDEYFVFIKKLDVSGEYVNDFKRFAESPFAPTDGWGEDGVPLDSYKIIPPRGTKEHSDNMQALHDDASKLNQEFARLNAAPIPVSEIATRIPINVDEILPETHELKGKKKYRDLYGEFHEVVASPVDENDLSRFL